MNVNNQQSITTMKPLNQNKMKQTAVEWFYNKLVTGKFTGKDTITFLFETAKEMEKEQIKNAWIEATPRNSPKYEAITRERAEEYYNKTFKK